MLIQSVRFVGVFVQARLVGAAEGKNIEKLFSRTSKKCDMVCLSQKLRGVYGRVVKVGNINEIGV